MTTTIVPETERPDGPSGFRVLFESESPAAQAGVIDVTVAADGCALRVEGDADPVVVASADAASIWFESVEIERQPALVMVASPSLSIRVNGAPAPPLAVLAVGDAVQIGERAAHVSWFRAPVVGPPPADLVGVRCAVCLTPFHADTAVIVHDCGQALHLEPRADQLQCALLTGDCPVCSRPVTLESGYDYWPAP